MRDLFDTLVTDRETRVRDKWAVEPDFDDLFVWESDDPTESDDDEPSLDEWLNG
jgi:hypothetical protein